ncbi:acyl carrier protein [Methylopila henanensis]|uniref:Acyl carrier protein n=1 Tax=Methylopila henanensis TaxID=873516 RepID=A0ABW4K6R4_9HYPH
MNAAPGPLSSDSGDILATLIGMIQSRAKTTAPLDAATRIDGVGIDSFDFVEIIFEVEEKYGIEVDYNANSTFKTTATIGDFAAEIARLVAAKSAA